MGWTSLCWGGLLLMLRPRRATAFAVVARAGEGGVELDLQHGGSPWVSRHRLYGSRPSRSRWILVTELASKNLNPRNGRKGRFGDSPLRTKIVAMTKATCASSGPTSGDIPVADDPTRPKPTIFPKAWRVPRSPPTATAMLPLLGFAPQRSPNQSPPARSVHPEPSTIHHSPSTRPPNQQTQ